MNAAQVSMTVGGKRMKIIIQIKKFWITKDFLACHQWQASFFFYLSLPKITWNWQVDKQHFDSWYMTILEYMDHEYCQISLMFSLRLACAEVKIAYDCFNSKLVRLGSTQNDR